MASNAFQAGIKTLGPRNVAGGRGLCRDQIAMLAGKRLPQDSAEGLSRGLHDVHVREHSSPPDTTCIRRKADISVTRRKVPRYKAPDWQSLPSGATITMG